MTKERKDNITVCSAVAMLIFGCVLTTIAFFYAGGALGIANYARSAAKHEVDERFHDYERRHHRHRIAGEEGEEIDDITTYEKPIDDGEN